MSICIECMQNEAKLNELYCEKCEHKILLKEARLKKLRLVGILEELQEFIEEYLLEE